MLSFIVIGRNEGVKLINCINSIYETIKYNNLTKYEIIYVDSNSSDNSINNLKKFNNIKIIKLTVNYNSAIARNIAVNNSSFENLFFIDGDMQIIPSFLKMVYNEKKGLLYNFVSGQFENIFYGKNGEIISKKMHYSIIDESKKYFSLGGLFFIRKKIWYSVNGMKNHFRRSQDLDLGLRLAKINIFLQIKNDILATHHTISYFDKNRIWKDLFSGNDFYRALLFRENLFNIYMWKIFIRENYTLIFLLFSLILVFFGYSLNLLLAYLLMIFLRTIINRLASRNIINYFYISLSYIIREFLFICALLFFWPKKNMFIKTTKF